MLILSEHDAARLGIDGATPRSKASRAREARPGLPRAGRAAAGAGERIDALMRLARAGWTGTNYQHATDEHYMTHRDGSSGPRCATYRAMIDQTLELL